MILNRCLTLCAFIAIFGNMVARGQCPGMVFAHLVDGSGWKSSIYLINGASGTKASYTLTFRGDNGQPVLLSFVDGRRDNQISGTIAPGGVEILETPGKEGDPLAVASAVLSNSGGVAGFGVIRERQAGGADREATVSLTTPVARGLLFPFDNTAGSSSSIAVAVPCAATSRVVLTAVATDEGGKPLGNAELKTTSGGHLAFVTADLLRETREKRGLIRISANGPEGASVHLDGVGLRYSSSGALTTFPPSPWMPAAVHPAVRPPLKKRGR